MPDILNCIQTCIQMFKRVYPAFLPGERSSDSRYRLNLTIPPFLELLGVQYVALLSQNTTLMVWN